jgi:pimeloyl-ACP methyl ester carboxylesterase
VTEARRSAIEAAHREGLACARGETTWEVLQEALKSRTKEDPGLDEHLKGLRAPREHWIWGWIRAVGDYDPLPHWKQVEVPMLFVYGGKDTQVIGAKSVARLRSAFAEIERNWSALEFAPNGHALLREDLADFAARWIRDRGAH